MTINPIVTAAAATWDSANESLEHTNARIHDGVPLHLLEARADGYVTNILTKFRLSLPQRPAIMEIGSGTGYIMEAMDRRLNSDGNPASSITGLDIARNMLEKARTRLGGRNPFRFQLYDGITPPLPPGSFDLVYSVAALQHVPKPFVYNLFIETKRLLKPGASAVFHLMPFSNLQKWKENGVPYSWADEIANQVYNREAHWHHFYTRDEVDMILRYGTGFQRVEFDESEELWVCAS